MQDLKDIIQSGKLYIPNDKPHLTPYKQKFSEITVLNNGTLLKQNKIILPHSLHEKVMRLVHNGSHPEQSRISSNKRWGPNKCHRLISATPLGIHIEISFSL